MKYLKEKTETYFYQIKIVHNMIIKLFMFFVHIYKSGRNCTKQVISKQRYGHTGKDTLRGSFKSGRINSGHTLYATTTISNLEEEY